MASHVRSNAESVCVLEGKGIVNSSEWGPRMEGYGVHLRTGFLIVFGPIRIFINFHFFHFYENLNCYNKNRSILKVMKIKTFIKNEDL